MAAFKGKVNSKNLKKAHIFKPRSFSDDSSPLCFFNLIFYLIGIRLSNSQTELIKFFRNASKDLNGALTVSASALSQARRKLKHTVFIELNRFLCNLYYGMIEPKKWNGYRLVAIDGTTVSLPDEKEVVNFFGGWNARKGKSTCPKGRGSVAYDPLNGITLDALLRPTKEGEETLFLKHLEYLKAGDLVLADRGYAGFKLFSALIMNELKFCIRMPIKQFSVILKPFMESTKKDDYLVLTPNYSAKKQCEKSGIPATAIKIRVVKVILDNGDIEVLATTLTEDEAGVEDLKELYHERWIVEELYKDLKCKIRVECFSSKHKEGILQDFHGSIISMNLTKIFAYEASEEIENEGVKEEYAHRVNVTNALSFFRDYFIEIVFSKDPLKIFRNIKQLLRRFSAPIRDGRSYPRKRKPKRIDFPLNYGVI